MICIYIKKQAETPLLQGHPWLKASDIQETSELMLAEPGELTTILSSKGEYLATATINPHSHIRARIFTRKKNEAIDVAFFAARLRKALAKREALYPGGYYRLVHAESDGLPGLIIDRFGDVMVCQLSTAGMERFRIELLAAIEDVIAPKAILFRNDIPARTKEALVERVELIKGQIPPLVEVKENGITYLADLHNGQKTGWFYDQRENRAYIASLVKNKRVMDMFCHTGGFGVLAAKQGAAEVVFGDSSAPALGIATQTIVRNNVADRCTVRQGHAYTLLAKFAEEGRQFDISLLDPPAFVKARKDQQAGIAGYQKLVEMATRITVEGGIVSITSCSHHAPLPMLKKACENGIKLAGRKHKTLRVAGAAKDHPLHPMLSESGYLKQITWQLD